MEMQKLSQEINKIEMSEEMKARILRNCYHQKEENIMCKVNKGFQKPLIAVASIMLCCCLVGVTALATSGKLKGFFKDIKRWDGAVTGTSYEQASDEINLSFISLSDELTVMAEMSTPDKAPYNTLETLRIETYEITDANGTVIIKGNSTEFAEIVNGKTTLSIPIAELQSGNYKLIVHGFVGSAKADQPLVINGNWICEFTLR